VSTGYFWGMGAIAFSIVVIGPALGRVLPA
jgi:hypothetical protein